MKNKQPRFWDREKSKGKYLVYYNFESCAGVSEPLGWGHQNTCISIQHGHYLEDRMEVGIGVELQSEERQEALVTQED